MRISPKKGRSSAMISAIEFPRLALSARATALADLHQDWKGLLEPDCDRTDKTEHEGEPCQHQQQAHDLFHQAEMATEAGEEAHERSRKPGRDPERHREAERVDGQQQCSVPHRVAR